MTLTEVEKLVARAQQGDGQAVEEILTLYRDKVYSLAFGLAGNHADAEDLAQEIFLKVYAALPTFVNDGRSFDAWVHRVGINLWIDWQRRRKKVQVFSLDSVVSTEDGEVDWEPASVGGNPEEELKKKGILGNGLAGPRRALQRLPHSAAAARPQRVVLPGNRHGAKLV